MITGEPLELSVQPFLTWGIFANGRYLTARIMESPRTEKGCSLSDILEENPDDKYFLSDTQTKWVMGRVKSNKLAPQILSRQHTDEDQRPAGRSLQIGETMKDYELEKTE